jgi:hypothetical protein
MAMTMVRRTGISGWAPTEQIAGTSVNCYSSQGFLSGTDPSLMLPSRRARGALALGPTQVRKRSP